jgi:hypothetical protein
VNEQLDHKRIENSNLPSKAIRLCIPTFQIASHSLAHCLSSLHFTPQSYTLSEQIAPSTMPPKAKAPSADLTEKHLATIRAVLCTADGFNPNYDACFQEYGLNKSGTNEPAQQHNAFTPPAKKNISRDFKQALVKMNIEWDHTSGKFSDLTKDAPAAAVATPTKTAKANGTAKGSAKANGQKRKQSTEEDDDAETGDGETVKKLKVEAKQGDDDNVKTPKVEEDA